MRITKLLSLLLLAAMCAAISCTKTEMFEDIPQAAITKSTSLNNRNSYRYTPDEREERKKTVLGRKRRNPFALENFKQAKVNIYGSGTMPVEATHLYVKFKPTEQEHLAVLEDWEITQEIPLFDFPLEYEIVAMGEQYVDPEVSEAMFTYKYGSIPVDTELPTVPYEVVDKLYLGKDYPLVLAESFRLTGNEAEAETYLVGEHGIDVGILGDEPVGLLPMIPECGPGCDAVLIIEPGSMPPAFEWICECDDDGGDVPEINDCGCPVPWSNNKPAGCVQVDKDGGEVPVKDATVIVKDNWFFSKKRSTTEEGCWLVDEAFSGTMWMWIKFANENVKAKNLANSLGIKTLRDYIGKFTGSALNNISVFYSSGETNNLSVARMYWAASHTLNTVYEYRELAAAEGMPLPKQGLNWIDMPGNGGAGAPMLQGVVFNSWISVLAAFAMPGPYIFSVPFLPDIVNQYGEAESAFSNNGVAFHELGHASHYEKVGESYWLSYRQHIIANNGYGSFGDFAPNSHIGHCALGEAVAGYVGASFGGTVEGSENGEWEENFIPEGLLHDLEDDSPGDTVTDPNFPTISGPDNISGFSTNMFFNALNPQVTNIREFRDELGALHLSDTPNSLSDYNTFVDIYDVFN